MKELLLYMAKNLVDNPDAVTVTETSDEDGKVLELRVRCYYNILSQIYKK